jgi:hypothetical protein
MDHEFADADLTERGSWIAPTLVPLSSLDRAAVGFTAGSIETATFACTYAPS